MARLLEIGGTNAAIATLLAIVVWAIARHWRQPAFVHLLWVLVLVKLITPPLLPIPWPMAGEVPATKVAATPVDDVIPQVKEKPLVPANNLSAFAVEEIVPHNVAKVSPPPTWVYADIPWTYVIAGVWLAGSAVWLAIAVGRLTRFHLALADAGLPSVDLQQLAGEVAAAVGVGRYRIRVTTGRLSPLVWPIGRPTIVMPQNLLEVLSASEQRAILTHEFAHLRRKDHWVRWVELVVTAIYWWHPVVWYARRQIQQAEERTCDAWVVRSSPATAKAYANALFQAVECATGSLRPAPMLASRVTSGRDLKKRIEHVINASWNAEMSTGSWRALWFTAMCILPVSLTTVYAKQAERPASSAAVTAAAPAESTQVGVPPQPRIELRSVQERQIINPDIDDASVLREQVNFLEQQFNKIDELYKTGAPGGTVDRWSLAGFELANARGELALAEGKRADALARFAEAEEFAGTSLKSTAAAYHANRVTLESLLLASTNLTDIRRRLIQLRRPEELGLAPANSGTTIENIEAALRRALAEQSSSESSTPSLAYYRKAVEQQKINVDRLQALADKRVVSAAELAKVKIEFELIVEGLRQAERKLESRRLLVQLAEVEYEQAVEANKQTPSAANELEVRRKKLMIDLAEAKVRELGE